jgi:hypothetical protein
VQPYFSNNSALMRRVFKQAEAWSEGRYSRHLCGGECLQARMAICATSPHDGTAP